MDARLVKVRVKSAIYALMAASLIAAAACSGSSASPSTVSEPPPSSQPASPSGPPKPLETATITITAAGFKLDSTSAASFKLEEIHVYQGATLLFVNQDSQPHDVQSDPPHIHTDCPEI